MELDALLRAFFGTDDLDSLDDAEIDRGAERVRVALGTEREPGRRFALWVILHGIGDAPDPAAAFEEPGERAAAEAYVAAMARAERG